MIRAIGVLVVGLLAAWLCVGGTALLLEKRDLLLPTLVASVVCLIPAVLTLVLALRTKAVTPVEHLQLVVVGSMIRIGLTAVGGVIAYFANEKFQTLPFLIALLGFYMLALAIETRILMAHRSKAS